LPNTELLKHEVEDFVRAELSRRFGMRFEKRLVTLTGVQPPPREHEFDAVSEDGSIIAGIITSGPRTRGGRRNVGAVHHATGELYYLRLVAAKRRMLVATDAGFRELMLSVTEGRLAVGLELIHIPLSQGLDEAVRRVRLEASRENSSRATAPGVSTRSGRP